MKKLLEIQRELKAPKSQNNTFGHYKYRSCEDIIEAVKPIAHGLGCVLTLSDELVHFGSGEKYSVESDGSGKSSAFFNDRFYIKATATLLDTETAETISVSAFARESLSKKGMDESQITGTASSYARKYALNGLFAIDDTKDSDTNEAKNNEKRAAPVTSATPSQLKKISDLLGTDDERRKKVLAYYKVNKFAEMTIQDASKCILQLEKK